jgi:ribonuclease R
MKKKKTNYELNEKNILMLMNSQKGPLTLNAFNEHFAIDKNQRKDLKQILKTLIRKGSIVKLKGYMFGIGHEETLITGTLSCTKSGNGFVITDSENVKDIFVSSRFMKNAFHGDTVTVQTGHTFRGRKEGKIVEVIKRNTNNITGYTKLLNNKLYIIPEDTRFKYDFVVNNDQNKLKTAGGAFVAARITKFPDSRINPECEIVKIFKNGLQDVRAITSFIEYKYDLPGNFKKSAESDAKELSLDISGVERIDLRKLKHITIDGELAKDFDDAVCIQKRRGGFLLFVSIADVSSYVITNSHLDREAYRRGTSVYFPGKVLPMLPKVLSNGLCSINPLEDKLALTVEMEYDNNGNIIKNAFYKSIIRSTKRLTYRQVEDVVTGVYKEHQNKLEDHLHDLEHMAELALLLKKKREERGSLDFDLPESEVILDIEGGLQNIIRSERLFSHQIIEEFMVSANEAVARFLRDNNASAIYRIHEEPDKEKLKEIEKFLYTLPIQHKKQPGSHFLQSVLQRARGTDYEFFINRILLRSMKQARYSAVNKGHFGLASDCYLHFTSPIRRYPDLICHRSLKNVLHGVLNSKEDYEQTAIHLSERERTAMEAERELEDRIRILFMKNKIGEVYQGIISHINPYGFFVELNEIFVEGLVLLADLSNDYYYFEEEKFRLIGKRTRKIYRIGDKVTIKVTIADVETKRLLFIPLR